MKIGKAPFDPELSASTSSTTRTVYKLTAITNIKVNYANFHVSLCFNISYKDKENNRH